MAPPDAAAAEPSAELREVVEVLKLLKADESLHDLLERPEVLRAVKHWTGEERLPLEQCDDWEADSNVMSVLNKFKRLQFVCRRAGSGVPLQAVLERRAYFTLPTGQRVGEWPEEPSDSTRQAEPAEKTLRLRCICADGVAYRKSPDMGDKDKSLVGPRYFDVITVLELKGDWVRAEKGWLPLIFKDEALFQEVGPDDLEELPERPRMSLKKQIAWQVGFGIFAIVMAKVSVWYNMSEHGSAMWALNALNGSADSVDGHEFE
mmetsp:Transcript_62092/g.134776  ORF Transcript_62092/g.134776 Transcript_62092/m.134776 type:complete len:262 (-) Transcript_62092:20-805(-)